MEALTQPLPISSIASELPNPNLSTTTATSEPVEAELSEAEQQEILRVARIEKARKLVSQTRDREYWKRLYEPVMPTHVELGQWILNESRRYDEEITNPRYVSASGFVLDEHSQAVFDLLCMYFTGNPAFERAGEFYDQFAESKFSLKKGIALLGPTGCGKTTLLWLFCDNPRQSYTVSPCKILVDSYESAATSADASGIYGRMSDKSDVYGGTFRQGRGGRAFDDLGVEPSPAKSFGRPRNLMLDILERRYDMGPDGAGLTHLTTNLTAQQIEDLYGKRLRSRMREMFNMIKFDPKTPDRRE